MDGSLSNLCFCGSLLESEMSLMHKRLGMEELVLTWLYLFMERNVVFQRIYCNKMMEMFYNRVVFGGSINIKQACLIMINCRENL